MYQEASARKSMFKTISDYGEAPDIIYKCPRCGISFAFYRDKEHFCHNCGQEIDWANVQRYCSPEQTVTVRKSWEDYLNNDATYWEFVETVRKALPGIVTEWD